MIGERDAFGRLLLGGTVAAGVLAWRASTPEADNTDDGQRESTGTAPSAGAWIYPVPTLEDRAAVTSSEFRARDSNDGKAHQHLGVDLMYRRRDTRDLIAVFPVGTPGGTPRFFMPEHVPALAASAGVVTFAAMTPVGNTIVLQHPNGWATYYTHLATLAVQRGASVSPGQTIGTIGASPKDAARLRHLHFEIWNGGKRAGAVDPGPYLAAWSRASMAWQPMFALPASSGHSPRNSALSAYRPVGESGERYPDWVRRLRGQSGVYVIREIGGPIVYVGSSIGRLYETLTRHFQTVRHEAQEVPMT